MEDWDLLNFRIICPFISFNAKYVPMKVQEGFIIDDIKITNEKNKVIR
tara:strand:- start:738 stop:881 length:144 start_codon:yes stop_codon:yes gene_type:complete